MHCNSSVAADDSQVVIHVSNVDETTTTNHQADDSKLSIGKKRVIQKFVAKRMLLDVSDDNANTYFSNPSKQIKDYNEAMRHSVKVIPSNGRS